MAYSIDNRGSATRKCKKNDSGCFAIRKSDSSEVGRAKANYWKHWALRTRDGMSRKFNILLPLSSFGILENFE